MPTIFSRIVSGEIPCYKIAEDEKYFAFLDINPLKKGHTLVIPKQETDYVFDLADSDYSGLFLFAKKVALKLQKTIPCAKIGIAVIGLEVPHCHIHLVPLDIVSDINFTALKLTLSSEEMQEIQAKIIKA